MMRTPSFTRVAVLVPAALSLLLAASIGAARAGGDIATLESPGPDQATPAPSAQAQDPAEAMLAFAQCMRDHGVDMPDPQVGSDGRVFVQGRVDSESDDGGKSLSGPDVEDPEFLEANEACSGLLKGSGPQVDPEQQAERQAQLLEFAQCMRDHGVDMPDPGFGTGPGGGASVSIRVGGPDQEGFDPRSEEFQAAREACGDGMFGFGPGDDEDVSDEVTDPAASVAP